MNLSLKSFSQIVQDMGAILQSSATALVDVSVGSVARAIFEANAGIALWMQWLILQVLQTTRASTSTGSDLDSWMADFGLTRLPALPSSGLVIFYRFVTNLPASIPPGTMVKTSDGTLSFSVVASPSVSIWDPTSSTYILPAGVASASIPVQCTVSGSQGNIVTGTISIIASSLPGLDQVTNTLPFEGGTDAETDALLRSRFVNYLAGLSRATPTAIASAVGGVQQGITMSLLENVAANGSTSPGNFVVVIDDGTGFPPASLLSSVASAVDATRPIGTTVSVIAPTVLQVSVSLTALAPQQSATSSTISSSIQQAILTYLNNLPIGTSAAVSRVVQAAYGVPYTIDNIINVTLDGGSQDITAGSMVVIKAGSITVSINAD
jgi:uncharacterized phage protein gp47/JayE